MSYTQKREKEQESYVNIDDKDNYDDGDNNVVVVLFVNLDHRKNL